MSILGSLFKKSDSKHPSFPTLPMGVRLNGYVRFKPSSKTYFLLNDGKIQTSLPDQDAIIKGVSKTELFGMDIYRVYLGTQGENSSIVQIHCDGAVVNDVIVFNKKWNFVIEGDNREQRNWENMIGWKDITPPDSPTYYRDWAVPIPEYGEMTSPIQFYEKYFEDTQNLVEIRNRAMLYVRRIDGGSDDDIEYLLTAFRSGNGRHRVEIWTGIVVGEAGIETF